MAFQFKACIHRAGNCPSCCVQSAYLLKGQTGSVVRYNSGVERQGTGAHMPHSYLELFCCRRAPSFLARLLKLKAFGETEAHLPSVEQRTEQKQRGTSGCVCLQKSEYHQKDFPIGHNAAGAAGVHVQQGTRSQWETACPVMPGTSTHQGGARLLTIKFVALTGCEGGVTHNGGPLASCLSACCET